MKPLPPNTASIPPERAEDAVVARQAQLCLDAAMLRQLYDAVSDVVLLLNRQRQLVFCNRRARELLGVEQAQALLGRRPGEVLGCAYAAQGPGGCGTSAACATCGAVIAVLASQEGSPSVQECRILRAADGEALDLRVRASPVVLGGETFTIVAATDISHEKRRRALERVFFHDLLNTATGIEMLSRRLGTLAIGPVVKVAAGIRQGIERLLEEIASQRDLMAAESRELAIRPVPLRSRAMLESLLQAYKPQGHTRGCRLVLESCAADVAFESDPAVLARVLSNMLKNAIEASGTDDTVTLGCEAGMQEVRFRVHNPAVMPQEVQWQLFQRSFSTKGSGRGLGTYSMRLLSERYLRGRIEFTSTAGAGTTFTASYPLSLRR